MTVMDVMDVQDVQVNLCRIYINLGYFRLSIIILLVYFYKIYNEIKYKTSPFVLDRWI